MKLFSDWQRHSLEETSGVCTQILLCKLFFTLHPDVLNKWVTTSSFKTLLFGVL